MEAVRWSFTVVLGLLWLMFAALNARIFFGSRPGAPPASMMPVVAGLVALLGIVVCPIDSGQKWWFFLAALVLDVGSLPYFVMAALASVHAALASVHADVSEAGGLRRWLFRWFAGRSWSFKLMLGTIGWLGVLFLTPLIWFYFQEDSGFPSWLFWIASVAYWTIFAVLVVRLRKYRQQAVFKVGR